MSIRFYKNLARVYTNVLHFYLQPSATMVNVKSLVGQVCPKGGHICPTKLVKIM